MAEISVDHFLANIFVRPEEKPAASNDVSPVCDSKTPVKQLSGAVIPGTQAVSRSTSSTVRDMNPERIDTSNQDREWQNVIISKSSQTSSAIDEILDRQIVSINNDKDHNEFRQALEESIKQRFPEEVIRDLFSEGAHGLQIMVVDPNGALDARQIQETITNTRDYAKFVDNIKLFEKNANGDPSVVAVYLPNENGKSPFLVMPVLGNKNNFDFHDHLAHEIGHALDHRIMNRIEMDPAFRAIFENNGFRVSPRTGLFSPDSLLLRSAHSKDINSVTETKLKELQLNVANFSSRSNRIIPENDIRENLAYYDDANIYNGLELGKSNAAGAKETFAQAVSSLVPNYQNSKGRVISDGLDEYVFEQVFVHSRDSVRKALTLAYPSFDNYLLD